MPLTVTQVPPPPPCPNTGLSKHGDPCFCSFGILLEPSFLRFQSNGDCSLWPWAGCRKGPYGCRSVGVAVTPCALVFWGVYRRVGHRFVVTKGEGWLVPATCVPWYGRAGTRARPNTATPCFRLFAPLNQNLVRVWTGGGGHLSATRERSGIQKTAGVEYEGVSTTKAVLSVMGCGPAVWQQMDALCFGISVELEAG